MEPKQHPMSNIEYGIGIITNSILDDLFNDIKKLNIDENTIKDINVIIDNHKKNNISPFKQKTKRSKSKSKTRVIDEDKQCQRTLKTGGKCKGIKVNNITNSCWVHMSQEEKDKHNHNKNVKETGEGIRIRELSYEDKRRLEDLVDE